MADDPSKLPFTPEQTGALTREQEPSEDFFSNAPPSESPEITPAEKKAQAEVAATGQPVALTGADA